MHQSGPNLGLILSLCLGVCSRFSKGQGSDQNMLIRCNSDLTFGFFLTRFVHF